MLIGLVTFPIMAGLGVVAEPFILVMLGEKWTPVIPIFRVLAAVGVFQSVQTTVGQIYIAKSRTDLMLYVGLANTAVSVAAFFIGVQYGVLGVAIAYAVAYFSAMLFVSLLPAFRLIALPFREFVWRLFPQLAITLTMSGVCLLWLLSLGAFSQFGPVFQLASTVLLGACTYIFLILRLRPAVFGHLEEIAGQDPESKLARLVSRAGSIFSAR
jgi:PST family polysaccharide transporter